MRIKTKISLGLLFLFALFLFIGGLGTYNLHRISENIQNKDAQTMAEDAIFLMGIVAALGFLLSFSFIFNFPSYIANPIKELTHGIKEIANKNYGKRLNFTSNDEFGELAEAFNSMAKRLNDYENSSLAQLISEKQRIETIIDAMQDPLIGLDENNRVLFVNTEGSVVLGMKKEALIGQNALEIALKNDLLRSLLNNVSDKPMKIFSNKKESYFDKKLLEIKTNDKAIGRVILLRNITQFQERDLEKENLMASMTHELKIQSMLSKNTAFSTDNFTVDQQNYFKKIKESNAHLTQIITTLVSVHQN